MASWTPTPTGASWTPTSSPIADGDVDIEARFRPSLVSRSKRRRGYPSDGDTWTVIGDSKLGDSYPSYLVTIADRRYSCSCQSHAGGEYRKVCSHILYVILARKGRAEFAEVPSDEVVAPTDIAATGSWLPLSSGGGDLGFSSPDREALNDEYQTYNNPPLPRWVEGLRESQAIAIDQILALYAEGKRVVFLDAPTGTGKTLVGELVRRKVSPPRAVYSCATKTLQDQFLADFPYAAVIKGRSNYPTFDRPVDFPTISADLCNLKKTTLPACYGCNPRNSPETDDEGEAMHCAYCHPHPRSQCPYQIAKFAALHSNLAVANMAYLLAAANYADFLTEEPLIIVDEADVLEKELMRFIEFRIGARTLEKYGLGQPDLKTKREAWVEWIREQAVPAFAERLAELRPRAFSSNPDPRARREHDGLATRITKLRNLAGWNRQLNEWQDDRMEGWVYTDYDEGHVNFKPVTVTEMARETLWDHAERWLLMSATMISPEQMATDLALEDGEWGSVVVGSGFPPERRPIYVQPVANMTFKTQDTAWPKMARWVQAVANWHPDERILVHSVSYRLAEYLSTRVKPSSRVVTYRSAADRDVKLRQWLETPDGIMISPSFSRGIDLPHDDCRVVVIAKVPFPNIRDKQVSARLYGTGSAGRNWYATETVRDLVQMTGRAMRAEDDHCEIYLLDGQFMSNIWKEKRFLLPQWWRDALVMGGVPLERKREMLK